MMTTQSKISCEDSVTCILTEVSTYYGLVHMYDSANYPHCKSVISVDIFYRSVNEGMLPHIMELLKLIRRLALFGGF
jgi:hypothetical protein